MAGELQRPLGRDPPVQRPQRVAAAVHAELRDHPRDGPQVVHERADVANARDGEALPAEGHGEPRFLRGAPQAARLGTARRFRAAGPPNQPRSSR